MSEFSGFSAVVTGGARGIGEATARALCAGGAKVTILDRDDATHVADSLPGCRFARVELRDPEAVAQAIDAAAEAQDGLDGLVNNAGVSPRRLLDTTDAEAWDELLAINLRSAFNCTKAAIPHLKARGAGAIVNLASVAGKNISLGSDVSYTVSKWGMVGFTRHLAYELAPWRIRVNAVFPGTTRTRLLGGGDDSPGGAQEQMAKGVPLGRLIEPEEIANAILFFLSPRAAMCTGAELVVDGGILLGSAQAYEGYFRSRGGEPPAR